MQRVKSEQDIYKRTSPNTLQKYPLLAQRKITPKKGEAISMKNKN
jgi:hypothetical protein